MTPSLSIVIPSLGHVHFLQLLLESLRRQDFTGNSEVLLCVTGADSELPRQLPALKPNMELKMCSSPMPGISLARNVGLDQARGETILFLDEDCFLPDAGYLRKLHEFRQAHPRVAGGGAYLTDHDKASFASAFYNYMCNAWLESHVAENGRAQVLLGGCCFYPRAMVGTVRFPPHKPRAGEEMDFNGELVAGGGELLFDPAWSVYHHPDYALEDVFARAWKHGLQLESRTVMPAPNRLSQFVNRSRRQPRDFVRFLPMTVAYGVWGRAAYASKLFRS